MDHQPTQDQMMLISQLFPAATAYTAQIVSQQGEMKKPRRRRNKKMKAEENGATEVFKKRKLSEEQMNLLEQNFGSEHKLDSERKDRLAMELGLDPRQVAVWFQNRRARWKNKKLEEEYTNLRKIHESTLLEKCRLETEVLKLREKLSEAEKEIEQQRQLENTVDGVPSYNSSSSSHSQSFDQAMDPPFLGQFIVDGYGDDVFYVPDLEWINNYPYI